MPSTSEAASFGALIREWRHLRGVSQEELAARAGISVRHASFLENARARPSRCTAQALARALQLDGAGAARFVAAAGYATGPDMGLPGLSRTALAMTLRFTDPWPAAIVNEFGDVRQVNRAWVMLHRRLPARLFDGGPPNLFLLLVDRDGWRRHLANWREIAVAMLGYIVRQAPGDPRAAALLRRARALPDLADGTRRGIPTAGLPDWRVVPRTAAIGPMRAVCHHLGRAANGDESLIMHVCYPEQGDAILSPAELAALDAVTHPLCPY